MLIRQDNRPDEERAEAIIEFRTIGSTVKVSAIDPATLVEVSIMAPVAAGKRQMSDAVLRKLRYVLARRKNA
jgi:uncharacterized protein DUF6898